MPFPFKRKKEEDTLSFKRRMAESVSGKVIKYSSERDYERNTDIVLGKEGSISLRNGEIIVLSSQNIVFRGAVDDINISELMSKDGVIIEGPDLERGGQYRKIIAYYLYYRK